MLEGEASMRFIFEQLRLGGDRNFAYLLGDREAGEALLVDPCYDPAAAVARAAAQGLKVTAILNTHGHADHAGGNAEAQALTGAPVLGGPGHAMGAFLGAVVFEVVKLFAAAYMTGIWQMLLGLTLIFVIILAPDGIVGLLRKRRAALTGDQP